MKPWRLQTRLLLLVMIPVSSLVLILAASATMLRFHDIENLENERMLLLLEKYQFAFDTMRNISPDSLQNLALAALEEPNVRALSLLDENKKVLLHSGPVFRPLSTGQVIELDDRLHRYVTPKRWIYVQKLKNPVLDTEHQLRPSWVLLEININELKLQKYQTLLFVSLLSVITLVLLGIFLSHRIYKWLSPVSEMADIIRNIDSQHFDRRLYTDARGDLFLLETEINALLERLATDTEELQNSMTQANEDLRETMEAMEVQNIELTLARKEAIEGNRIKSEFLANISHEIRTPLNGIMGFAKLLLKTKISPRQLDYTKTIIKSSESLLAIINDVLDLSKIEAGKLVLDHTPLDIEEVIYDVLDMLAPLADDKNLEQVAFIYDDVPRHLMGDPLRLKQIITNLVSNAIKFTASGEIIIRCMLEKRTEHHVILRITVTDTGIGLSQTAKNELFRAFSQGDPSTTRKFGGTGLGLVISRHLVEQMHGEINFESHEKGTTFWFTIRTEIDHHLHSDVYGNVLQGKNIFIAESHLTSRQFLTSTLSRWGAQSKEVDSLEALYDSLQESPVIDAVIINVALLGKRLIMSDFQLNEIRRLVQGPILLIARTADDAHELKLPSSLMSIMTKPVIPRMLYQHLAQLLSTQPQTPPKIVSSVPSLRVLAVDDNPANLKLVCTLLEDLHVVAIPATDGYQAIELCQKEVFDLVFMDIQMPGMSGLEATQAIRKHEQETNAKKHLPIIALTAHAMANERAILLKAGMDDYLTKPIQESQIVHTLIKWTGIDPQNNSAESMHSNTLPSSQSANALVDWSESVRLAAGKTDLARDMLIMLFNSLEQERRRISDAYADNNMNTLLERVHYLHGATRYCGVPELRQAAHTLETKIKSLLNAPQSPDDATQDTPQIDACADSLGQLLEQIDALIDWQRHNDIPE